MAQTKPDKPRQPTFRPLSVEQLTAIDVLVMGKSDAETAEAAGVTRPTVTDWRNHQPVFIAMLNARRSALWAEAHERLRALVGQAIENLETAVQEGKIPALDRGAQDRRPGWDRWGTRGSDRPGGHLPRIRRSASHARGILNGPSEGEADQAGSKPRPRAAS